MSKPAEDQYSGWILIGSNPSFSPFDGTGEFLWACVKCHHVVDHLTNACSECGDKKRIGDK